MMVEKMKVDGTYLITDKFSIYRVHCRDGHRQRASYNLSNCIRSNNVIISFDCSDCTETHNYVDVILLYNNENEARKEFSAQISEGFFENCNIGKIELKVGNDLGNIY